MLRGKYRSTFVIAWVGLKILKQGDATLSVEDLFLRLYQSLYIRTYMRIYFDVMLTVHLSIILVINQLNAENLVL